MRERKIIGGGECFILKLKVIKVFKEVFEIGFPLMFFLFSSIRESPSFLRNNFFLRRCKTAHLIEISSELLTEAQNLLDFLMDSSLTQELGIEAEMWTEVEDFKDVVMLILGSPSPQTFIKAGKQWAKFYKETGIKVPVIISTGRGRGYKSLVLRTIEFLDNYYQDALQDFVDEFRKDIDRVKTDVSPEALMREEGKLTEAKVIEFLFKIGVKESLGREDYNSLNFDQIIQLEEKSNNTRTNMLESFNLIKKVNKSKIIVITDAFHRLRALLAAVEVFNVEKGKNWQICAPALFVPELRVGKDFESFSTLEELLGYLTHMTGDPLGSDKKERMGEVERICMYFLDKSKRKGGKDLFEELKGKGFRIEDDKINEFKNIIEEWLKNVRGIREALVP